MVRKIYSKFEEDWQKDEKKYRLECSKREKNINQKAEVFKQDENKLNILTHTHTAAAKPFEQCAN